MQPLENFLSQLTISKLKSLIDLEDHLPSRTPSRQELLGQESLVVGSCKDQVWVQQVPFYVDARFFDYLLDLLVRLCFQNPRITVLLTY